MLVDNQPVVCRGLRMWLALEPDLDIVGESDECADMVPLLDLARPDIVLVDLEMTRSGGMTILAALRAAKPDLPVVVLSLHDDIETRARARLAGVAAFVAKHDVASRLLATIRTVARLHQCGGHSAGGPATTQSATNG